MKFTEALKKWLRDNCGVKDGATEDDYTSAYNAELAKENSRLTPELQAELAKDATPESSPLVALAVSLKEMGDSIKTLATSMTTEMKTLREDMAEVVSSGQGGDRSRKLFGGGREERDEKGNIKAKPAHTQYSTAKRQLVYPQFTKRGDLHPRAGQPLSFGSDVSFDSPSKQDMAVVGAFFKLRLSKMGIPLPAALMMTDHDRDLVKWYANEGLFVGTFKDKQLKDSGERLEPHMAKALLEDTLSGGDELVPIYWDNMIVTYPLLYGELSPFVDNQNVDRGSQVESGSLGNPSVYWGTADNTESPLFDTSGLANDVNTSLFEMSVSLELGNNFLSDSPVDVAGILMQKFPQVVQADLDRVIAVGNGTSEPEGVMTASGVSSVSFGSAAPTVSGYEAMIFGIAAKYLREPAAYFAFCSNQTTYSRARGIPVGSNDARRIFGMSQMDYMLFDRPYKINEDMANTKSFFGNLKKYRLYRRKGTSIQTSNQGESLIRRNVTLVVLRGRWGGRVMDPNGFVKSTTHQA